MELISKKESKFLKIDRKRDASKPESRRHYIDNKFLIQGNVEVSGGTKKQLDTEFEIISSKEQQKMGSQWWKVLDQEYFSTCTQKDILLTRDLLGANKFLNQENCHSEGLKTYEEEYIYSQFPFLRASHLIHVLFKSPSTFQNSLISLQVQNALRGVKLEQMQQDQQATQNYKTATNTVKITSCRSSNCTKIIQSQQVDPLVQNQRCNLSIVQKAFEPNETLTKVQQVQQLKSKHDQVSAQLILWQNQADRSNSLNGIFWNKLLNQINHSKSDVKSQQSSSQFLQISSQVSQIRQALMYSTILRYMEYGTKDKTNQMLKKLLESMSQIRPAKSREGSLSMSNSGNKKFFQTDCKICFCSFNYDTNQVLYCDRCNTSFHLACYGLDRIPEEFQYFCDCCTQIKKQQEERQLKLKRITCQICCKPNFPLKNINGHFYHMTCLVLFNFITIKKGEIALRDNLTHETIQQKVVLNEMQSDESCLFCGSSGGDIGMRLKCSHSECVFTMHPICAYINGCRFEVSKKQQKDLNVFVYCNQHDLPYAPHGHQHQDTQSTPREHIEQTYLRRYMCNFKNTSQKSKTQFISEYQSEMSERKSKNIQEQHIRQLQLSILQESKLVKKHINSRQAAIHSEKQQRREDDLMTESRKMLEKLSASNQKNGKNIRK